MRERSVSTRGDQRIVVEPVPRAAVLAPWWNCWVIGACSADDLIDAMAGFGRHHVVDVRARTEPLIVGLAQLRAAGRAPMAGETIGRPALARVVLPVPGDPLGLPGPTTFNQLAVQAGQSVVLESTATALIPNTAAGSTLWTTHAVDPDRHTAAAVDPSEASRAIAQAMLQATQTLGALGPLDSRDEVGRSLHDLDRALELLRLPPSLPPGQARTATTAARVLGIVSIAAASQRSATTGFGQDQVTDSLLSLARTARHTLAAACNAPQTLASPRSPT
ncbi:MAG: hypothetical protein WCP28_06080 [Actinomycetes bacterium]